jgi:hypothetical protein
VVIDLDFTKVVIDLLLAIGNFGGTQRHRGIRSVRTGAGLELESMPVQIIAVGHVPAGNHVTFRRYLCLKPECFVDGEKIVFLLKPDITAASRQFSSWQDG